MTADSVLVDARTVVEVIVKVRVLVVVTGFRLSLYPEYDIPAPRTASTRANTTRAALIFIIEPRQFMAPKCYKTLLISMK
jgi:hypothetical protein